MQRPYLRFDYTMKTSLISIPPWLFLTVFASLSVWSERIFWNILICFFSLGFAYGPHQPEPETVFALSRTGFTGHTEKERTGVELFGFKIWS